MHSKFMETLLTLFCSVSFAGFSDMIYVPGVDPSISPYHPPLHFLARPKQKIRLTLLIIHFKVTLAVSSSSKSNTKWDSGLNSSWSWLKRNHFFQSYFVQYHLCQVTHEHLLTALRWYVQGLEYFMQRPHSPLNISRSESGERDVTEWMILHEIVIIIKVNVIVKQVIWIENYV